MTEERQPAPGGKGPLLQRDYWAVIKDCELDPQRVVDLVRRQFCDFAPPEIVRFAKVSDTGEKLPDSREALNVGDALEVKIRMMPKVGVRVSDVRDTSLTLCTLKGHPEAGRITFGAYRNDHGDVIFHIRSRARSKSVLHLAGFRTAGDAMQTNTWTDFIDRLAHTIGDGIVGEIYAEMSEVDEREDDVEGNAPTFIATAD